MKRTPLARVSPRKAAKRRTHSQKKALRPARYCADPLHPRCFKQPVHFGFCGSHARAHLDLLQRRDVVRPEVGCEAAAWHGELFPCGGQVQVNHVIDRDELLVHWHRDNVIAGCRDLNVWAHHNRRRWWKMFRDWRGEQAWAALEDLADAKIKLDWDATHVALHARLGESGEREQAVA